jgi:hypothetical protein
MGSQWIEFVYMYYTNIAYHWGQYMDLWAYKYILTDDIYFLVYKSMYWPYIYIFIIFVYYLETLIGWKRVTWRSIKSGIARTLLIIVTPMQYTNLFLETSALYTIILAIWSIFFIILFIKRGGHIHRFNINVPIVFYLHCICLCLVFQFFFLEVQM